MSKVFKQKKTQEQEKPDEVKRFAAAAFKQARCHIVHCDAGQTGSTSYFQPAFWFLADIMNPRPEKR